MKTFTVTQYLSDNERNKKMTNELMLYRVILCRTGRRQPGEKPMDWNKTVLYCGYDRHEARRTYYEVEPLDFDYGPGNRAQVTLIRKRSVRAANANK